MVNTRGPDTSIIGVGGHIFEGIYSEVQRHTEPTTNRYIVASRISQGHEGWAASTSEERRQMVEHYRKMKDNFLLGKRTGNTFGSVAQYPSILFPSFKLSSFNISNS
jgi:hypothetical protein